MFDDLFRSACDPLPPRSLHVTSPSGCVLNVHTLHAHIYSHTYAHTYPHTYTYNTHTYRPKCARAHVHLHTPTLTHAYTRVHLRTRTHTFEQTHTRRLSVGVIAVAAATAAGLMFPFATCPAAGNSRHPQWVIIVPTQVSPVILSNVCIYYYNIIINA